jgi:hypothetical protein
LQELILLQKIYGQASLEDFQRYLKSVCGGLSISCDRLWTTENAWVGVRVSGSDERVATHLLERQVGLAPVSVKNAERFSVLRGKVIFSGASRTEVFVDVGVFSPKPIFAQIPLQALQAQLADGAKLALRSLVERFVLSDNSPLEVRVTAVSDDMLKAELTEAQLEVFDRWIRARFDRLIVLGALVDHTIRAVRQARIEGGILRVESLGFLEHAIVCKLGTDGVGLVPKLGRRLRGAVLRVFSPRTMRPASS